MMTYVVLQAAAYPVQYSCRGILGLAGSPGGVESISIKGCPSKTLPNPDAVPLIVQVNRKDETNIRLEFYRKPGMTVRITPDASWNFVKLSHLFLWT
jgi:hypothetical protein